MSKHLNFFYLIIILVLQSACSPEQLFDDEEEINLTYFFNNEIHSLNTKISRFEDGVLEISRDNFRMVIDGFRVDTFKVGRNEYSYCMIKNTGLWYSTGIAWDSLSYISTTDIFNQNFLSASFTFLMAHNKYPDVFRRVFLGEIDMIPVTRIFSKYSDGRVHGKLDNVSYKMLDVSLKDYGDQYFIEALHANGIDISFRMEKDVEVGTYSLDHYPNLIWSFSIKFEPDNQYYHLIYTKSILTVFSATTENMELSISGIARTYQNSEIPITDLHFVLQKD